MDDGFVNPSLLADIGKVICSDFSTFTESTYNLFSQLSDEVILIVNRKVFDQQLIHFITSHNFVNFFTKFITLMCENVYNLEHPENPLSASFILVQYIFANTTDTMANVRQTLYDSDVLPLLVKLLLTPVIDFELCMREENIRMLVHSSCLVLRNIIQNIPEATKKYQEYGAQDAFKKFFHPLDLEDISKQKNNLNINLLSLQQTCLSSLSFLLSIKDIERLPNLYSIMSLIVHELEESLKSPIDLSSESHGCAYLESMQLLIRLLHSKTVAHILISNNVVKIIEKALKSFINLRRKHSIIRFDVNELATASLTVIHDLLAHQTGSLSVFSLELRRLVQRFSRQLWTEDCQKIASSINSLLNNAEKELSVKFNLQPKLCESLFVRLPHRGHLFLIHSLANAAIAQDLIHSLKKIGFDVRASQERDSFFAQDSELIDNASTVIALVSPEFPEDYHCKADCKYAYNKSKLIIPVCTKKSIKIPTWLSLILPHARFLYLGDPPNVNRVLPTLRDILGYFGVQPFNDCVNPTDANLVQEDGYTEVMTDGTGTTNEHIMVSYTHASKKIAWKIKLELDKYHKTWLDEADGSNCFLESMAEAIKTSKAVIALICSSYTQSRHCSREICTSFLWNKFIIPIQLEPELDYPYWLQPLKYDAIMINDDQLDIPQVVQIVNQRLAGMANLND